MAILHPRITNPSFSKSPLDGRKKGFSLICGFHGCLLRSTSPFPFFMAVAFEAGGLLRAILLLLQAIPVSLLVGQNSHMGMKAMAFFAFCGLKTKHMDLATRAVLPRLYMEDLDSGVYEVMAAAGRKVVCSSLPRVMVERFLKEYLGVDEVVAPEMHVIGERYSGFFASSYEELLIRKGKVDVGILSSSDPDPNEQFFLPHSKEVYVVNRESRTEARARKLPRENYPKPLVFHDGRLAFLPTPSAALALFLWLPFAAILSVLRMLTGIVFHQRISLFVGAAIGVHIRVSHTQSHNPNKSRNPNPKSSSVLYVCNHRTLLDPIFLSLVLCRSIPAVTYSLSPISEAISPIHTVRLTRDRCRDAATIRSLLAAGDLAICPEGTTCREPYLLRFSSLFAELTDNIEPVAMKVSGVSVFYGTTATGLKWLDPIFFFMNPRPSYHVAFLRRVPPEMTVAGGWSAADVANRIQKELAEALGFQCTKLTRRDKYLVLAGNDGVVLPSSAG
ncbi:hypothetical protein HPP92_019848 [Vanilla planifolia]|uniref:Phospholipid/glycerol acyltransferase domain-containing protein n=1 Tax=Vanilla planifolia TaxID=51239 RepID=A0A835UJQ0_VANPL|nr:hypothetical protein HPP92_020286 [Vanilla planifolia]KAG0465684.1 hypothetical protein HPP92_019848 [Vanilla planifolia]